MSKPWTLAALLFLTIFGTYLLGRTTWRISYGEAGKDQKVLILNNF